MPNSEIRVRTTLLYPMADSIEFGDVIDSITQTLDAHEIEVLHTYLRQDEHVVMECGGFECVLIYSGDEMGERAMRSAKRPGGLDDNDDRVLWLTAGHEARISVEFRSSTARDRPGIQREAQKKLSRLCARVAHALASATAADVVHWEATDMLYSVPEFLAHGPVREVRRSAPRRVGVSAGAPRLAPSQLPEDVLAAASGAVANSATAPAPADAMPGTATGKPGLDPVLGSVRLALYPELAEAAEEANRPGPKLVNGKTTTERVAIYTMNTTVILMSAPVGAALLTYNVLSGESLTRTARTMSLTGVMIALSSAKILPAFAQPFF